MKLNRKKHNMKKPFHILLVLAAAMMLLASGCACTDITEGLIFRTVCPAD
jgi:hypothetical protein